VGGDAAQARAARDGGAIVTGAAAGGATPYYRSPSGDVTLYRGDALAVLRALPAGSVHTCITSPPYWGLRDYSVAGQLGLEETPVAYVAALVAVFAQVWRVLRDDGTLWLNLGDSYASPGKGGDWDADRRQKGTGRQLYAQQSNRGRDNFPGLKAKDLCGVPWRVAFALQDAGWTLRSDIIWSKPNPMPESVRDRPTRAHEYVFLLSKGPRYFYDATAIAEATTEPPKKCGRNSRANVDRDPAHGTRKQDAIGLRRYVGFNDRYDFENPNPTRNRRSVWEIATEAFPQSHFATFPIKLVEPMLLASTSARGCCPACGAPYTRIVEREAHSLPVAERTGRVGHNGTPPQQSGWFWKPAEVRDLGWRAGCACEAGDPIPAVVLDPFAGACTTGVVARKHGRHSWGIDLSATYLEMARERLGQLALPLIAGG
jgi:DNA modification methylase